jgi:hypothetical protein
MYHYAGAYDVTVINGGGKCNDAFCLPIYIVFAVVNLTSAEL